MRTAEENPEILCNHDAFWKGSITASVLELGRIGGFTSGKEQASNQLGSFASLYAASNFSKDIFQRHFSTSHQDTSGRGKDGGHNRVSAQVSNPVEDCSSFKAGARHEDEVKISESVGMAESNQAKDPESSGLTESNHAKNAESIGIAQTGAETGMEGGGTNRDAESEHEGAQKLNETTLSAVDGTKEEVADSGVSQSNSEADVLGRKSEASVADRLPPHSPGEEADLEPEIFSKPEPDLLSYVADIFADARVSSYCLQYVSKIPPFNRGLEHSGRRDG
jgi:hypothetical protein